MALGGAPSKAHALSKFVGDMTKATENATGEKVAIQIGEETYWVRKAMPEQGASSTSANEHTGN